MIYQPPFEEPGGIWPLRWRRRRKSYGFKADVFSAGIMIRNCLKTPKEESRKKKIFTI